ncbi:hypothetical protein N7492_007944 [Penicillium capsulatum]|uniref:Uncharacterized protein n=1 Tax=Penicillium capsulatum TaxID=69766 RepID=A0A9W9LFI6_9EURO|nr:hypothetical protein N7492_007944 [Penicillium capsulatum]KAJ6105351.1 hypothetical protein N7512_008868 [Penicillium capsulatum]
MHFQLVSVLALASLSSAGHLYYYKEDGCKGQADTPFPGFTGCSVISAGNKMKSVKAILDDGEKLALYPDSAHARTCGQGEPKYIGSDGCIDHDTIQAYPWVEIYN